MDVHNPDGQSSASGPYKFILEEFKSGRYVRFKGQIADYIEYAEHNGAQLRIWIRDNEVKLAAKIRNNPSVKICVGAGCGEYVPP